MKIEIRAWLIKEKKMVSVSSLGWGDSFAFVTVEDEDSNINAKTYKNGEDCVVMWPVGRKDVRGKEIYEGDIVSGVDYGVMAPRSYEKVEYYPDPGVYSIHDLEDIAVLGNIYENPELLKTYHIK